MVGDDEPDAVLQQFLAGIPVCLSVVFGQSRFNSVLIETDHEMHS